MVVFSLCECINWWDFKMVIIRAGDRPFFMPSRKNRWASFRESRKISSSSLPCHSTSAVDCTQWHMEKIIHDYDGKENYIYNNVFGSFQPWHVISDLQNIYRNLCLPRLFCIFLLAAPQFVLREISPSFPACFFNNSRLNVKLNPVVQEEEWDISLLSSQLQLSLRSSQRKKSQIFTVYSPFREKLHTNPN